MTPKFNMKQVFLLEVKASLIGDYGLSEYNAKNLVSFNNEIKKYAEKAMIENVIDYDNVQKVAKHAADLYKKD